MGDWISELEIWGDIFTGVGMGGVDGGTGDDLSVPLVLGGGGSWGDTGLLEVFGSVGEAGTGTGDRA